MSDLAIAGRGLARSLVLGTALATDAFALVDVIWMASESELPFDDPRSGAVLHR